MKEIFKILKKYNLWGHKSQKEIFEVGFERDFYLKKIEQFLGNDLIKVFIGQRRVGKSYLMRQVINKLLDSGVNKKNIFYFNKEIVDFDEVKTHLDLKKIIDIYRKEIKPKGKVYYFFDEIQEIENWEKIVNSLSQDYKYKSEVFVSGSNSKMLSGELATYISGRYIDFEIFPFSYREYRDCFKLKNNKENFLEYLHSGGLPEFFQLKTEESKRYYLQALKNTIILKDIVDRYKIKDIKLLEKILDFISDNIGNVFSSAKITNFLKSKGRKISFDTVSNYLKYLTETFLIHEVERFDLKGKDILDSGKKYYLNDLSFRNFIFSTFDEGVGGHLENLVYLHFRRNGWKIYIGKIDNLEIDFVIEKHGEKKYIQVAHSLIGSKVIKREFGNLEKIQDSYEKIVISLDDKSLGNKEGIKHQLAWIILNNENS